MWTSTSSPKPRRAWSSLVENLREAYRTSIDGLEWMSPETKKQAQEKLAKFRPKVGYPSKWRDYSKLEIKRRSGRELTPRLRLRKRIPAEQSRQAHRSRTGHDPADGECAFHNPVRNEIVFPAAILQPPFFNMEADDAANYGGIGGVIGHEMDTASMIRAATSTPRASCATGGRKRMPRNTRSARRSSSSTTTS